MPSTAEPGLFRRNLRHWTLHVLLGASGSFACAAADQWRKPQSLVGMLVGIGVFIGLYTWVWSSGWFRRRFPAGSIEARALLYATRLRSALGSACCLSILLASSFKTSAPLLFFFILPEFMSAFLLGIVIDTLRRTAGFHALRLATGGPDAHQRAQSVWLGDVNSLLPTFFITLGQGCLLSLMLLVFAVGFTMVLLVRRAQRRDDEARTGKTPALT